MKRLVSLPPVTYKLFTVIVTSSISVTLLLSVKRINRLDFAMDTQQTDRVYVHSSRLIKQLSRKNTYAWLLQIIRTPTWGEG